MGLKSPQYDPSITPTWFHDDLDMIDPQFINTWIHWWIQNGPAWIEICQGHHDIACYSIGDCQTHYDIAWYLMLLHCSSWYSIVIAQQHWSYRKMFASSNHRLHVSRFVVGVRSSAMALSEVRIEQGEHVGRKCWADILGEASSQSNESFTSARLSFKQ